MTLPNIPGLALPSGGYYQFFAPHLSDYTIEDVAHMLAQNNRYNGGCRYPYSVAQHSVNCSRIVAPEFALEALMHDAAEFAFGDMTSPLKQRCPDYCSFLQAGEHEMSARFDLPLKLSPEVKLADMQMLKLEKEHLLAAPNAHPQADWPEWEDYILHPSVAKLALLSELSWIGARRLFLYRYYELTDG